MKFLGKIYCHINNFSILSNVTAFLLGISIVTLVCVYFFHMFFKRNLYERNINVAGVLVRVILFMAFSVEIYHQVRINSLIEGYFFKEDLIEQIINFLFWGYIFTVGIFYIFTINVDRYKGFFYTFDIVMLSVPIVQGIAVMIICLFTRQFAPFYYYISILLYAGLLYVFFKAYWLRSKKWYIMTVFISVILIGISMTMKEWAVTRPISVFIFLSTVYEILRIKIVHKCKLKKYINYILTSMAIILVLFCSPYINLWDVILKNYTYDKDVSIYRNSSIYNSLENAKNLALKAVNNYTSKVVLVAGNQQDFYNGYFFQVSNYDVREDDSYPRILNVTRRYKEDLKGRSKKEEVKDVKFSKKDIIKKSIEYIQSIGYTYDPKLVDIRFEEETSQRVGSLYKVKFYNKYTDGTIEEETDFHKASCCVYWRKDGTLEEFSANGILNLKDMKEVTISYKDIESKVQNWYQKMNKKVPAYVIEDISDWYLFSKVEVRVRCKNDNNKKDELVIDGVTGEVQRFTTNIGEDNCEVVYNKQENEYTKDIDDFNVKDMKISKEKAVKLVLKRYKYFGVYNERVKAFQIAYKNGKTKFKWMVRVIPYGTMEHHIYFVDPITGDIHTLDNYKAGVKNEYKK
ncbi:hypothetical protein [Clostridium massiliodielmoense]|uniref:hypothetical protein n=1 Tax=Clostridium massiliodielmoense TaxID=1776385 RepID=UPI0004D67D7B|nr:hypothetical protein [Clostridium massiliodielmoense]KEH97312.1 hypothetical protein Z962_04100 [Clostridium botulinum C/D str. BKT12695]